MHTADLGLVWIKQLGSIVLAVLVINLWEETVWPASSKPAWRPALVSSWPPSNRAAVHGVHVPLLLLDDHVMPLSILIGIAGLLILGIVIRQLMGVTLPPPSTACSRSGSCTRSSMPATTTAAWSIPYWMAPMPATWPNCRGILADLRSPRGCSGDVLAHSPDANTA